MTTCESERWQHAFRRVRRSGWVGVEAGLVSGGEMRARLVEDGSLDEAVAGGVSKILLNIPLNPGVEGVPLKSDGSRLFEKSGNCGLEDCGRLNGIGSW